MLENMFLIEITHLESETGKKLVRFLLYGEFTQPFVCYIDCNLKGIVEVPFPTSHHQGYFRPCATTHTGRYATPAALYLLLIPLKVIQSHTTTAAAPLLCLSCSLTLDYFRER